MKRNQAMKFHNLNTHIFIRTRFQESTCGVFSLTLAGYIETHLREVRNPLAGYLGTRLREIRNTPAENQETACGKLGTHLWEIRNTPAGNQETACGKLGTHLWEIRNSLAGNQEPACGKSEPTCGENQNPLKGEIRKIRYRYTIDQIYKTAQDYLNLKLLVSCIIIAYTYIREILLILSNMYICCCSIVN